MLDWDARIFLFHNFLSPEECDHIISLSEKRMTRSGVVQTESGGSAISEIRTSYGVFLDRAQDPVITGECTALPAAVQHVAVCGPGWWCCSSEICGVRLQPQCSKSTLQGTQPCAL